MGYKKTCVEVEGVFYESISSASRELKYNRETIKRRCFSDKFPNYKIVPYRIIYTKKKCAKCGKVKSLKEFNKCTAAKDGVAWECRECSGERGRNGRENNPELFIKRARKWVKENIEHRRRYAREYAKRDYIKIKRNEWAREKRRTDLVFKINNNLSSAIWRSLKTGKGRVHWEILVGYTIKEFMTHMELLFTKDMTWDNYGWGEYKWNLEHRKPKKDFHITSVECQGFLDYWALPNLQPMWQLNNFRKHTGKMKLEYLIKPF